VFFAVLFFLAVGYSSLFAQEDLFEFKRFIVLPVVAYSEETGTVLGAGAMFFIEPPTSSDIFLVMSSFRKQASIVNKFVYEAPRWNFLSHIYLANWPTQILDYSFTSQNIRIPLAVGTNFFMPKNFNYGLETDWEYITFDNDWENSMRTGIGYNLTYNSREKNDWPRKGSFVQFRHIFYNKNSFIWKNLDTRMYIPLFFLPEGALALSSYLEDFDGDVPIDRLAQPDGVGQLRGLKKGVLAGKTSWVLQSELRTHLFWRCKGTLFYEMAKVGKDVASLNDSKWHRVIGIGGRFLVNKESKTHLRGDISLVDEKDIGMAVQINEAF